MSVVCQLCGFECNSHLQMHLLRKHNGLTPSAYEARFPGFSWMDDSFREKMRFVRKQNAITPAALEAKSKNGRKNKGKVRSEEYKQQRSLAYLGTNGPFYGRRHSLETKIKLSCHFRGISEEQFDDFTKPESFRQVRSGAFRAWRRLVFERDNYACLLCNKRGGALEPHHIIPRREDRSKIYEVDNGATLCEECHKKTFKREHEFAAELTEKVGRRLVSL